MESKYNDVYIMLKLCFCIPTWYNMISKCALLQHSNTLCHVAVCHVTMCHVAMCHVAVCHVAMCHVSERHVTVCHVAVCDVAVCHVAVRHVSECHMYGMCCRCEEEVYIPALQTLLLARSPVFSAMFSGSMSNKKDDQLIIDLPDVEPDAFKQLIR